MAKLTSTKYPTVASHANDILKEGTVSWDHMRKALILGHPILDILSALMNMACDHGRKYGRSIAYDGVLGDYWIAIAKNARRMLDGDFGPIDNGCVEWYFWHVTSYAGFTEQEVENA